MEQHWVDQMDASKAEYSVARLAGCWVALTDVMWVAQMDGSTAVHSAARSAVRSVALMDES